MRVAFGVHSPLSRAAPTELRGEAPRDTNRRCRVRVQRIAIGGDPEFQHGPVRSPGRGAPRTHPDASEDPDIDLPTILDGFVDDLAAVIPSYLGLQATLQLDGRPVTLSVIEDADAGAARASLRLRWIRRATPTRPARSSSAPPTPAHSWTWPPTRNAGGAWTAG